MNDQLHAFDVEIKPVKPHYFDRPAVKVGLSVGLSVAWLIQDPIVVRWLQSCLHPRVVVMANARLTTLDYEPAA